MEEFKANAKQLVDNMKKKHAQELARFKEKLQKSQVASRAGHPKHHSPVMSVPHVPITHFPVDHMVLNDAQSIVEIDQFDVYRSRVVDGSHTDLSSPKSCSTHGRSR